MKKLIKPVRLKPRDKVVITATCSGEGVAQPERYQAGKDVFSGFDLEIVETYDVFRDSDWLYAHPKERAGDFNWAFGEAENKAVISVCGGDNEGVMTLNYIDFDLMCKNAMIYLGYSDNTFFHFVRLISGQASLYGPNVMEFGNMDPYTKASVTKALFSSDVIGEIPQNQESADSAWRFISGTASAEGRLIGGCIEVLEIINGTKVWPDVEQFAGTILFLETPEQQMWPEKFEWFLRNLGAQGILNKINGLLFGKPGWGTNKVDPAKSAAYDRAILKILKEYQREDLPVITNMPIGHTLPMMTVPYGCLSRIDVQERKLVLLESAVDP